MTINCITQNTYIFLVLSNSWMHTDVFFAKENSYPTWYDSIYDSESYQVDWVLCCGVCCSECCSESYIESYQVDWVLCVLRCVLQWVLQWVIYRVTSSRIWIFFFLTKCLHALMKSCQVDSESYVWHDSFIWMSNVTRTNDEWRVTSNVTSKLIWLYAWVMSHKWMSNVTRTNDVWPVTSNVTSKLIWLFPLRAEGTHTCDRTHWYVWPNCDMTHWYVWHNSFMSMIFLIRACGMTRHAQFDMTLPSALWLFPYVVATISRLLKIIGLFCKRAL